MFVSRKGVTPDPKLNLMAQCSNIEQVKEARLLGVIVDERLTFSSHISEVLSRMGQRISVVARARHYLSASAVRLVLEALVLSCLSYCPAVWSSATKQDRNRLQVAQNRAARLALGCSRRDSVEWMHEALAWLTVEQRLACSLITFLFNVYKVKKPQRMLLKLQPTNERHNYNTRNASKEHFTLPVPKSNALKRTVMYRAETQWNELPPKLIQIKNKDSFKLSLKKAIINKEITIDLDKYLSLC